MQANSYAFCTGCGFGIEVNVSKSGHTSAEFYNENPSNNTVSCYYCHFGKVRTGASIKHTLAEAQVLLLSAKRINATDAIEFYSRQVARCNEALGITETQGSLFQ